MKLPELKQPAQAIVLGLVSGLVAIYFILQWKFDKEVIELLYVAAGIGLLSSVWNDFANIVAKVWMLIGQLMGKVVGSVLLTVVYFVILTPISWLQRLFSGKGKFSVQTKETTSTWIERKHQFVQDDLKELW